MAKISVLWVDVHHFDADADPDPSTQISQMLEYQIFLLLFKAVLVLFYLSR
jgi:hypothetical protein